MSRESTDCKITVPDYVIESAIDAYLKKICGSEAMWYESADTDLNLKIILESNLEGEPFMLEDDWE